MNWAEQIDGYCERMDLSYWSEPFNALTNAAFLIAALILWRRTAGLPLARALCVILGLIGIGSYLFHTLATVWAATADVLPILVFGLLYLFAANRDYLGWPVWVAVAAAAAFLPFAAGVGVVLRDVPFLGISSVYWAFPILFFIYGAVLWRRSPETGRGLLIAGAILSASISARSTDEMLCETIPMGTHFLWHILNAVVLGWVIEVYRRHKGRDSTT